MQQNQPDVTLQTNDQGMFHFPNVSNGNYELRVQVGGFWDAAAPLTVSRHKESDRCGKPLRVVMKPAGQCSYVENAWPNRNLR
jgi:hypothetical protein